MSNCCSRTSARGYSYAFRKITVYQLIRDRRNATRKLPVRNGFLMGPSYTWIAHVHACTHTCVRVPWTTWFDLQHWPNHRDEKLTAFFVFSFAFAFRHRALNLERRYTWDACATTCTSCTTSSDNIDRSSKVDVDSLIRGYFGMDKSIPWPRAL